MTEDEYPDARDEMKDVSYYVRHSHSPPCRPFLKDPVIWQGSLRADTNPVADSGHAMLQWALPIGVGSSRRFAPSTKTPVLIAVDASRAGQPSVQRHPWPTVYTIGEARSPERSVLAPSSDASSPY